MIKVRFVDGKGFESGFIEFWTWSDWSHVDVWTPDGWLGARSDGGVQIRAWNYCDFKKEEIRVIELDAPTEAKIMTWLDDQRGKKYDYLALLGMPIRDDLDDRNRWFCSELIAAAFKQAGVPLLNADHLNRITPRDLYLSPLLKSQ